MKRTGESLKVNELMEILKAYYLEQPLKIFMVLPLMKNYLIYMVKCM